MLTLKKPLLRPTSKGHSYFSFISEFWMAKEAGWDRAFHRLCSLMRKMDAQNVVIEEIKGDSLELSEEKTALDTYFGHKTYIKAFRFTFLSENISTVETLLNKRIIGRIKDLADENFLASATLINFRDPRNNWHSYLQKAIVCIPKLSNTPLLNNYIHIHKIFNCSVDLSDNEKRSFNINGTFFCQQNSITSVCAHASLCMIINNMDMPGLKTISSEWINRTLGIDHTTKKVGPDKGLSENEVKQVLKKAGLKANWYNFFNDPNSDYAEYIYRYVEGKCPSLLIFSTTHSDELHVVPVIGHTLNSDIWRAEAELAYNRAVPLNYRPASEWVDHFIIHDDNFGMYLCLPIDSLRKITLPKHDPTFRSYLAIAITPSEIRTPAREAEWTGALLIRRLLEKFSALNVKLGIWLERLADERTPMVIRTMIMSKENYKRHLSAYTDFKGKSFKKSEISALTDHLPDYFWLSEITLPDLYTANKSKVVDFIYVCDKQPAVDEKELSNRWIQIRLPGACRFNRRSKSTIPLTVNSHCPLYRHKKDIKIPEW